MTDNNEGQRSGEGIHVGGDNATVKGGDISGFHIGVNIVGNNADVSAGNIVGPGVIHQAQWYQQPPGMIGIGITVAVLGGLALAYIKKRLRMK